MSRSRGENIKRRRQGWQPGHPTIHPCRPLAVSLFHWEPLAKEILVEATTPNLTPAIKAAVGDQNWSKFFLSIERGRLHLPGLTGSLSQSAMQSEVVEGSTDL